MDSLSSSSSHAVSVVQCLNPQEHLMHRKSVFEKMEVFLRAVLRQEASSYPKADYLIESFPFNSARFKYLTATAVGFPKFYFKVFYKETGDLTFSFKEYELNNQDNKLRPHAAKRVWTVTLHDISSDKIVCEPGEPNRRGLKLYISHFLYPSTFPSPGIPVRLSMCGGPRIYVPYERKCLLPVIFSWKSS